MATTSKAGAQADSSSKPQCQKDPGNPSSSGSDSRTKKCPVPTPPPPPPPVATGKATITGTLFFDLAPYDGMFDPNNEVGIAGWNVVLTGPTATLRFMTDGTGFFSFSGLDSGVTYTLCVEPVPGWTQTTPTSGALCLNSVGFSIDVPAVATDTTIANQNFGFYSNP